MTSTTPPDPIRDALDACGVRTRDFLDEDDPEAPYLGPLFTLSNAEIGYRRPNRHDLLVIVYRRLDQQHALANPFADLLAFLRLATEPRFGLRRVLTNPIPWDDDDPTSPPAKRLERAYISLFEAEWTWYNHQLWLCRDAAGLHQRMKQLQHKASRLPGCTERFSAPPQRLARTLPKHDNTVI